MGNITNSNYETVTAICPSCGAECIFNRIDDLKDVMPISGREVTCDACQDRFWIKGDMINTAWRFLLDDAEANFAVKRYVPAIAAAAQAWEVFFATCALSTFAYGPFFALPPEKRRLEILNGLVVALNEATAKFTFFPLRNLAIRILAKWNELPTIEAAHEFINRIMRDNLGGNPPKEFLASVADSTCSSLVSELLGLSIAQLRNDVVHGSAYRPSRSEVERCLTSEIDTLYRVKLRLGVGDLLEHQSGGIFTL